MLLDQAKSLNLKLAVPTLKEDCQQNNSEEYKNFIRNLLTGAETEVPGGPKSGLRSIIRSYFEDAAKVTFVLKHIVLRARSTNCMKYYSFPDGRNQAGLVERPLRTGLERVFAISLSV